MMGLMGSIRPMGPIENCFWGSFAAVFPGSFTQRHGWSHAEYTPRLGPGSEKNHDAEIKPVCLSRHSLGDDGSNFSKVWPPEGKFFCSSSCPSATTGSGWWKNRFATNTKNLLPAGDLTLMTFMVEYFDFVFFEDAYRPFGTEYECCGQCFLLIPESPDKTTPPK